MEIEVFLKKSKEFYTHILNFLESESDSKSEFQKITEIIEEKDYLQNYILLDEIFRLIYVIGENHHRMVDFFGKLGAVLQYLIKDKQLPISNKIQLKNLFHMSIELIFLLMRQFVLIFMKVMHF